MNTRILLVEDNPDDVVFISAAFEKTDSGVVLDTAETGEAAVERLRVARPNERPDLILLDLNLPGRSGHEVLADLRTDARWREVPIIVLSTSASESDRRRALNNRASAYVVKPHDFREYESLARAIHGFWFKWMARGTSN